MDRTYAEGKERVVIILSTIAENLLITYPRLLCFEAGDFLGASVGDSYC